MKNVQTKLLQLFVVSRPVSWVNTAYPFVAGYLLTVRQVDLTLIIGALFFLIPYNLIMYGVNDVFDYESDIRNPRKGGVEGALLPRSAHRWILLAALSIGTPFLVCLLFLSNGFVGVATLLLVVGLVLAYSVPVLRFKERPYIDSMTSSAHFVGPLVYALTFSEYQPELILIVLSFFAWGMASHAFGAVQDIIADRHAKINSIATYNGARTTVRLAIGLYVVSGLLLLPLGSLGLLVGLINGLYIAAIWPFRSIVDAQAEISNAGWKNFMKLNMVAGFVITMVLIYLFWRGVA